MKSKSLFLASALSMALVPLTSMGVDKERSTPSSTNYFPASSDAPQSGKTPGNKSGASPYDGFPDSTKQVGGPPIAPNQQPKNDKSAGGLTNIVTPIPVALVASPAPKNSGDLRTPTPPSGSYGGGIQEAAVKDSQIYKPAPPGTTDSKTGPSVITGSPPK